MAPSSAQTVRLRPADPFDLIRWLARSQSDPRKAVAELVQNSIDADARVIVIERRRVRGGPGLLIRDDGQGILPDVDREEALRTIATNIGHSRKRGLSPRQRHEQVVTGKYGIGLLGFWSVGHKMEIRSRIKGSPVVALRLVENQEKAEIARLPTGIGAEDTYTEICIWELHDAAARALAARRLCDYLAAELRGPILASGVTIEIRDSHARGTAQKIFPVVPRRFTGEPLSLPPNLEIAGHPAAQIELYLVRGSDEPTAIQVSCTGTLVADDIGDLRSLDLNRPPWVGRSLGGLIDFPGFNVPPGSRRGVAPDAAAEAFVTALHTLRPLVEAELARFDRERGAAAGRQVMTELKRAMRGLRDRLPQYEMPRVPGADEGPVAKTPGGPLPPAADDADEPDSEAPAAPGQPLALFPPGPLVSVRIPATPLTIAPGGERRVSAVAVDIDGRRITVGVSFVWSCRGNEHVMVVGDGPRPAVRAGADARPGLPATLQVVASQEGKTATAEASVVVNAQRPSDDKSGFGIPEPELVDDPNTLWRSRFDGERWQVNASHPDYLASSGDGRTRFRYLLALLAKEIVQRTHGTMGTEPVLESFVEILTHAERNLRDPATAGRGQG